MGFRMVFGKKIKSACVTWRPLLLTFRCTLIKNALYMICPISTSLLNAQTLYLACFND